jgi:F-type H+-transporting ATPase subunit beta
LERFLTQPFFATEQFSGIKGKLVSLKDSLDGCERILQDEFKDYPESALYMIGAIDEAMKNVPKNKPDAKAEPGFKHAAKADPKTAADAKPNDKPEPQQESEPKPKVNADPKPKPEVAHAADSHAS